MTEVYTHKNGYTVEVSFRTEKKVFFFIKDGLMDGVSDMSAASFDKAIKKGYLTRKEAVSVSG